MKVALRLSKHKGSGADLFEIVLDDHFVVAAIYPSAENNSVQIIAKQDISVERVVTRHRDSIRVTFNGVSDDAEARR